MRSSSVTVALVAALAAPVGAHTLVALDADGNLVVFRADQPGATSTVKPTALSGRLAGIDTRPADGRLYGVTTSNDVYRLDPTSGRATLVSTLTVPFDGAERSGVDFTPQLDRLLAGAATTRLLEIDAELDALVVQEPPNDGVLRTSPDPDCIPPPLAGVGKATLAFRPGCG